MKKYILSLSLSLTVLSLAMLFTVSAPKTVDAAYNWTVRLNSGQRNWSALASSADGTRLAATAGGTDKGYVYTSTDSGKTWTEQRGAGFHQWLSITSSADGMKLAATIRDSNLFFLTTSVDGGVTWTPEDCDCNPFTRMTSSADGMKLAGFLSRDVYTSSDRGVTWNRTELPTRFIQSISSSADGSRLIIGSVNYSPFGDYIFTSSDGGATWIKRTSAGKYNWTAVTSSADGMKLAAATDLYAGGGYIHTSSDGGITWTPRTSTGPQEWMAIASSADGMKLAATSRLGIYVSSDSGATWSKETSPAGGWTNYANVVLSANGNKIVATDSGYYINTGEIRPLPCERNPADQGSQVSLQSQTNRNCTEDVRKDQVNVMLDGSSPIARTVSVSGTSETDVVVAVFDVKTNRSSGVLKSVQFDLNTSFYAHVMFSAITITAGGVTYTSSNGPAQRSVFKNLNIPLPAGQYVPIIVTARAVKNVDNVLNGQTATFSLSADNSSIVVGDTNNSQIPVVQSTITGSPVTFAASNSLIISNTSAQLGAPIYNQGKLYAYPVTFTYTLTAGDSSSPAYVSKELTAALDTYATGYASNTHYPPYISSISTNPTQVPGDSTAYSVILPGTSRTFMATGLLTNDMDSPGAKGFGISVIYYGFSPQSLRNQVIRQGLEGLKVSTIFNVNTLKNNGTLQMDLTQPFRLDTTKYLTSSLWDAMSNMFNPFGNRK